MVCLSIVTFKGFTFSVDNVNRVNRVNQRKHTIGGLQQAMLSYLSPTDEANYVSLLNFL